MLTFAVTGTVPLEKTPRGLEFDPNGRRLYITQAGSESVAVAESNAVENSIRVGSRPHWVAAGPDNKTALTANEESNDISIIDLETGAVTNLRVGNAPRPHLGKTMASARTLSGYGVF